MPTARNGLRITQDGKSITIFPFLVSMEVELEDAFWMVVTYCWFLLFSDLDLNVSTNRAATGNRSIVQEICLLRNYPDF